MEFLFLLIGVLIIMLLIISMMLLRIDMITDEQIKALTKRVDTLHIEDAATYSTLASRIERLEAQTWVPITEPARYEVRENKMTSGPSTFDVFDHVTGKFATGKRWFFHHDALEKCNTMNEAWDRCQVMAERREVLGTEG